MASKDESVQTDISSSRAQALELARERRSLYFPLLGPSPRLLSFPKGCTDSLDFKHISMLAYLDPRHVRPVQAWVIYRMHAVLMEEPIANSLQVLRTELSPVFIYRVLAHPYKPKRHPVVLRAFITLSISSHLSRGLGQVNPDIHGCCACLSHDRGVRHSHFEDLLDTEGASLYAIYWRAFWHSDSP